MSDDLIPILTSEIHPAPMVGEGALAQAAYVGANFDILSERLFEHLKENPDDMGLLMDLSVVLQFSNRREEGLIAQREALSRQQIYRVCGSGGPPVEPCLRVLAFMAPGDLMTNTPLEFIFEHILARLDILFLLPDRPLPEEVPDHDVAFVAVSHSDDRVDVLERVARFTPRWPRPVLQDPSRLLETSREGVSNSLNGIEGVVTPEIGRIGRDTLTSFAKGDLPRSPNRSSSPGFPLLLRPIDSHAGKNLAKINSPAQILSYLAHVPDSAFYRARFVDYSGRDGLFRKYRIVLIEGRPFICHMAVSDHWMIHYANAGMIQSVEKRQEEAKAMAEFQVDFGRRHSSALRAISERVGLQYLGIDCAETNDGRLLVFEADAAMVVHAMDPPEIFPYKRAQMERVFLAFHDMLKHTVNTG